MRKVNAIVWVGVRQMLADPVYLMFLLAMPVMMTWLMSFLPVDSGIYEMAILGVLVMFVGLNILTSAGGFMIEEKQAGTWQRMLASTTGHAHILSAYFIRLMGTALVQSLILIMSGKYLFGAPWNQGFGEIMVVLTVYIFIMTGLALFLSGFLKSAGQVQAVAMAIVMIGTMLGGVFIPIEDPSSLIRFVSAISPQSWAVHALKDIFLSGATLGSMAGSLLAMTGAGLLFLTAGVIKLQNERF
jgi:ABC-2 type transport system permease protein